MTEPYTYTDADGDELTVIGHPDDEPHIIAAIHGRHCVRIPAADVPGVIRGILAKAAAAQGHDTADPLAHIRADHAVVTEERPGGRFTYEETQAAAQALSRVLTDHMPLLLALAAAYLGDDDRRTRHLKVALDLACSTSATHRKERDDARAENERLRAENDRQREQWDKLVRTLDRVTTERDEARAEAAEMSQTLGENVGQALIEKTMLKGLDIVDGQVQLDIDPARELLLTWCAAVRAMLDHHGAEDYTETEITAPREAVSMDIQDGQHNTDSYTLTLQRRFRPTPHEMRQRAERALADTRRVVAEWIHAANSGDDRNASDLMRELEQAGVPLTAELDAIEAARTQAAEPEQARQ